MIMPNCIFLDTETTGLDPVTSHVIEIWAEVRDYDTLELVAPGEGGRVTLPAGATCSTAAAAVNGYTEAAWASSEPWEAVWARVWALLADEVGVVVLIGSNPRFDLDMIRAMHWRHGTSPWRAYVLPVDLRDLSEVKQLKRGRVIPSAGLASLAAYCDLGPQDHTARGDVALAVEVYRRLR